MRTLRTLLLIPFLLGLLTGAAFAKAPPKRAGLDPSFGRHGAFTVTSPEELGPGARVHLAVAPSNKSYVLRGDWIYGFGANGRPDPGFGEGGRVLVTPKTGALVKVSGITVDSQGRILVAGALEPVLGLKDGVRSGTPELPLFGLQPVEEAFVIRYFPNGTPDPTFGSGGEVVTTFGAPRPLGTEKAPAEYERPVAQATQILVDSQNRPVIAGKYVQRFETCFYKMTVDQAFVGRLTESGAIDTSFGEGGKTKIAGELATALTAGGGGSWATLSGREACEHGGDGLPATLTALTESGGPQPALDPSRPTLWGGEPLLVDAEGRYLYPEREPFMEIEPRVVRLLPNGDLDPSFGRGGALNVKRLGATAVGSVVLDRRGRVIVGFGKSQLEIGRASAAGKLETKFGDHGVVRTKLKGTAELQALAVDSKGRIVAAGMLDKSSVTSLGIAIARFLPGR